MYKAVLMVLCAASPGTLAAQDVQPRVYTPAPVGVNAISLNYAFSTGRVLFDKTIPVENVEGDIHSISAAYSRTLDVFGLSGRVDIGVPFVIGDWTGEVQRIGTAISRRGFGDPLARFSLFLIGAPALTRAEFAQFRPKTVVGATVRVRVPLGQYDAERLINLGSNRWAFSPQIGVSQVAGNFLLEAYVATWFFTDNTAALGTSTFSQNPLFVIQVHAAYVFRQVFWLAISSRQSLGGATSLDGGEDTNREANNRIGLTLGIPIAPRYSLRLVATTGLITSIGNDYNTLSMTWQVAF